MFIGNFYFQHAEIHVEKQRPVYAELDVHINIRDSDGIKDYPQVTTV